jgi:Flp pilus assembly pilin Flp
VVYIFHVIGGATYSEIAFVAVLVALVLLAPVAPRIGEAIGGLFEKK